MITSEAPETTPKRHAPLSMWLWLGCALAILVVGGWWVWADRVPPAPLISQRGAAPAVGHPAPNFTLQTLDGDTLALNELAGTPVVLNFWATWCGPCRNEMPALQAASERFGDRVRILGVDQAEDAATVQEFIDELGITFTIPMDAEQQVSSELYNVQGLPTTYFIDSEGIISKVWMGEMNSITLEEGIAEMLH
jgi:peroxiredoxin